MVVHHLSMVFKVQLEGPVVSAEAQFYDLVGMGHGIDGDAAASPESIEVSLGRHGGFNIILKTRCMLVKLCLKKLRKTASKSMAPYVPCAEAQLSVTHIRRDDPMA